MDCEGGIHFIKEYSLKNRNCQNYDALWHLLRRPKICVIILMLRDEYCHIGEFTIGETFIVLRLKLVIYWTLQDYSQCIRESKYTLMDTKMLPVHTCKKG